MACLRFLDNILLFLSLHFDCVSFEETIMPKFGPFGIFEHVRENTIGKYRLQKLTINHISFMSNHSILIYNVGKKFAFKQTNGKTFSISMLFSMMMVTVFEHKIFKVPKFKRKHSNEKCTRLEVLRSRVYSQMYCITVFGAFSFVLSVKL